VIGIWFGDGFGSASDYVLSKIFGSGSDSDTIEIFRCGSDYQISISAQHWSCRYIRPQVSMDRIKDEHERQITLTFIPRETRKEDCANMISKYLKFSGYNYYPTIGFRMATNYFIWIIRFRAWLNGNRYPI